MISDVNIYVNRDLCFACGICVDRCIMDNLRLHLAPCRIACPLHMNCQGYIRLIALGKEKEAAEEMRKYLPFGGILGRVCHYPCEAVCERMKAGDGAVHIRALKRYLAHNYPDIATEPVAIGKRTGKRVAIIGSGPSGLMAGHDLRFRGHEVMIYEAASEPGGLLRWGIPSFRLPTSEVDAAISMIEEMGAKFETGRRMGKDFEFGHVEEQFDAILMAVGAGAPISLGIAGEDQDGVYQGLDLLRQVKENKPPHLGHSVIVIGGGNCAVDSALTCKKIGVQDVKIICLEDHGKMSAFEVELMEAEEEGVVIESCWGPRQFMRMESGKLGVEVTKCLKVYDEGGAFCPVFEDECNSSFEADAIVVAIGQNLKSDGTLKDLIQTGEWISVDPITFQSPIKPKVFSCGDAVTGPNSVVNAMAQGREAAISIDRFLRGDGLKWGRAFLEENGFLKEYEVDIARAKGGPRQTLKRIPVGKKVMEEKLEKVLTPDEARKEAERCLSCGRAAEANQACWYCLPCELDCPVQALEVKMPYLLR